MHKKPEFFSEFKLFKQRLNTKPGDIITMREYAYATSDIDYASVYFNEGGIMHKIYIPENARVSGVGILGKRDEIVFPRSSKFKCIGTSTININGEKGTFIELEYILPDETWHTIA